jgi:undecaprenyl-diphosphatase
MYDLIISCTQIIIESLPLSSSGHVWLVDQALKNYFDITPSGNLSEGLMDLLFIPSLFIIALFFRNNLISFLKRLPHVMRCVIETKSLSPLTKLTIAKLIPMIFVANGTTTLCFVGLKLSGAQIAVYPSHMHLPMMLGFAITGLTLLSSYFAPTPNHVNVTLTDALLIGAAQGLSLLPGVSRLGMTLVSGHWIGLDPLANLHFSILLQVTLFVANFMKNTFLGNIKLLSCTSFDCLWLILAVVISYVGLCLTVSLQRQQSLWKLAPYMLVPILITFLSL